MRICSVYELFYAMRLKQKYKHKSVYECLKGMFQFNVSLGILRGFKINLKVVLKGVKGV